MDEYLHPDRDGEFFAAVKRYALAGVRDCQDWLDASACRWALGEFARRMSHEAYDWKSDEMQVRDRAYSLRSRQVAALTRDCRLFVGWCAGETTDEYVRIQRFTGVWDAGMYEVCDIFRLPSEWELAPWPHLGGRTL